MTSITNEVPTLKSTMSFRTAKLVYGGNHLATVEHTDKDGVMVKRNAGFA